MRALKEVEKRLLDIVDPEADAMGLEVVRLRLSGGRQPVLQIMIEKAGGAATDVEDCANFSRALSPVLDVADPVSGSYTLEVSTPGIDRPLTRPGDFGRWVGHLAKVELARALEGRRRFTGTIVSEVDGAITLDVDEDIQLQTELDELTKASLVLTDALIDAARQAGTLPAQPDDETADPELEIDTDDEDPFGDEFEVEEDKS